MCAFGISRQARGAALVIVMLVMAVLLLAGTTFLTISSTESQIALNEQGSAAAQVLADAAIHKALARLIADPNYSGETNTALGGGTFSIGVTTVSGCTTTSARKIVATASVPVRGGQAQAQLQVTLDKVSYPFRWAAFAVTADRSGQELFIDNDGSVDSFDSGLGSYSATNRGAGGNIGANGDLTLDVNANVQGNVTAGGTLTTRSGVTVSGSKSEGAPSQSLPSITPETSSTVDKDVSASLSLPSGDTTNCNTTTRICYYRTMIFRKGVFLTVDPGGPLTIYVTGSTGTVVDVKDDVRLNVKPDGSPPDSPTNLSIITRSDLADSASVTLTADDNFQLYGSLYGKSTNITLGNDAKIYGSMIGRKIRTGRRVATHFDQAMYNQEVCQTGKFTIRRGTWREVIPST